MPLNPGDREFFNLIIAAITFYLRHKANIDDSLSPALVAAMTTLVNASAPGQILHDLNKPGPQ